MTYDLPRAVCVGGKLMQIRSDYREVLEIFEILDAEELTWPEKVALLLRQFYVLPGDIPSESYQEAMERCLWFLRGGAEEGAKKFTRLVYWQEDFRHIIGPVNRALGSTDARGLPYLHWWTFLSAYGEIGDCFFAHIVRARRLEAEGGKKGKEDQRFYLENKEIIEPRGKPGVDLEFLRKFAEGEL